MVGRQAIALALDEARDPVSLLFCLRERLRRLGGEARGVPLRPVQPL